MRDESDGIDPAMSGGDMGGMGGEEGWTAPSYEQRVVAGAKIMMIDDEPLNMEVLQVHLEAEGYSRFVSVDDSRLALARLREENPDVLLLDLLMPHVSGFEILDEMRRDPALRQVPVIVLTSSNDAPTKLRALQSGATDFLAKPVDASELALRMRNTLASRAWQQRVSDIDPLTELPNRLFFTKLLGRRLAVAAGGETLPPTALILVNINRFKAINDSLGAERGDEILRAFRDRLVAMVGHRARIGGDSLFDSRQLADASRCCVARLGGDRFALLLPFDSEVPDAEALTRHLGRFVAAMESPFSVAGEALYLDASVGVAMLGSDSSSVEALVNDAETAMRHAQRRGGTAFAFYAEQMDARARELLSLENGLRTAVGSGEIFLVYQPKVAVRGGAVVGAEALVRWLHPEFGLISPVDFIPIAEDSGMIVSIGEWVLERSCRQARAWHETGHAGLGVAVNVSIRQLQEPDFVRTVERVLAASGLEPDALTLELTENMLMENAEGNVLRLRELKALGVRLSIDDFGTGYSSLSYLQRFPLDQLKVDRSFIREIRGVTDRAPIVKAVISLAHDLGLTVVAEGIENRHQLARIQAYGCEEYQGYFCSPPVEADALVQLVEAQRRAA